MVFSESDKDEDRGFLQDLNDGLFVQSLPLFSTDDCDHKLLIYYDDVNVANPMTNKIHQLGLYFFFCNLLIFLILLKTRYNT